LYCGTRGFTGAIDFAETTLKRGVQIKFLSQQVPRADLEYEGILTGPVLQAMSIGFTGSR